MTFKEIKEEILSHCDCYDFTRDDIDLDGISTMQDLDNLLCDYNKGRVISSKSDDLANEFDYLCDFCEVAGSKFSEDISDLTDDNIISIMKTYDSFNDYVSELKSNILIKYYAEEYESESNETIYFIKYWWNN